MMRPASTVVTIRLSLSRAISGCHVTSTKCARKLCKETLGFVVPSQTPSCPLDWPWPLTDEVLAAAMTLSKGTPDEAGWARGWTDPAVIAKSEVLAPLNRPGVAAATINILCCAFRAASITAGMSEAVIADPPDPDSGPFRQSLGHSDRDILTVVADDVVFEREAFLVDI